MSNDDQKMSMLMDLFEQLKKKDVENKELLDKIVELTERVEALSKIPVGNTSERERSLSMITNTLADVGSMKQTEETKDKMRKLIDYIIEYGQKQSHLS